MKIGNLEIYGIIYKIENLVNGKIYIGQTIDGFDKRYGGSGVWWEKTSNSHLKNSVNKYGLDKFKVIKIFDIAFSKNELDIKEDFYIKLYRSTNAKYGYNKRFGGAYGKHTEETKKKMKIKRKENNTKEYRLKVALQSKERWSKKEYREKMSKIMSKALSGEKNGMYGKNIQRKLDNYLANKEEEKIIHFIIK